MTAAEHEPDPTELAALGAQFAEIAAAMKGTRGEGADPEQLVRATVALVPHAEHCGVTLIRGTRRPQSLAASGELTQKVDDLQHDCGEGPCLDASLGDDYQLVEDLVVDERWPRFAARCVEQTGVRSILAVRLLLSGEDRAALNLYASKPSAFDQMDLAVASILGPFAGLSVERAIHESDVATYQTALTTSRQIGRAVGILMAQHLIPSDTAFKMLKQASQQMNRKLRDVAAQVEETGLLPEPHR